MASRRLALNLSQGLRKGATITKSAPWARGFATPVTSSSVVGKVQTTTLKNGLTVRIRPRHRPVPNASSYAPGPTPCGFSVDGQDDPPRPSPAMTDSNRSTHRSLPTTRPGRRRPLSACGSTPARGPRPPRTTAPLTSSSTSPSRYRRRASRRKAPPPSIPRHNGSPP